MSSWKSEVIADSSGKWVSNMLRFATKDEAERYGYNLAARWTLVTDYRATECNDPVTDLYTKDGFLENPETFTRFMPIRTAD